MANGMTLALDSGGGARQRLRPRNLRPIENVGIVLDQRFGIETEILPVDADHGEGVGALGQLGQVAPLDAVYVAFVNVQNFRDLMQAQSPALALPVEEPACFTGRVDVAVGFRPMVCQGRIGP